MVIPRHVHVTPSPHKTFQKSLVLRYFGQTKYHVHQIWRYLILHSTVVYACGLVGDIGRFPDVTFTSKCDRADQSITFLRTLQLECVCVCVCVCVSI
jgi:hypothetical protein